MYKKVLLTTISLIMANNLQAGIVNSLEKSSCKDYMNLSQEQTNSLFAQNIKNSKSNINSMNISPLCIELKKELMKVDETNYQTKIKYLIKSEKLIKDMNLFQVDLKSVEDSINKEYFELNSNLVKDKVIDPKDKKTLSIEVKFLDEKIQVNKIERIKKGVIPIDNVYTKSEFISKYPLLAKSHGVNEQLNIKKEEPKEEIIKRDKSTDIIETQNIKKEKENIQNVKQTIPQYVINKKNVILRSEPYFDNLVELKKSLDVNSYVWGVVDKETNQIIKNGFFLISYYLETPNLTSNAWIEKKYLNDFSDN